MLNMMMGEDRERWAVGCSRKRGGGGCGQSCTALKSLTVIELFFYIRLNCSFFTDEAGYPIKRV